MKNGTSVCAVQSFGSVIRWFACAPRPPTKFHGSKMAPHLKRFIGYGNDKIPRGKKGCNFQNKAKIFYQIYLIYYLTFCQNCVFISSAFKRQFKITNSLTEHGVHLLPPSCAGPCIPVQNSLPLSGWGGHKPGQTALCRGNVAGREGREVAETD